MNPSPLETHYFDYITYYEPDGLSLQAYCQEKGIPYDEMSAWLEEMKRNAAKKAQEISTEEKEQINSTIDRLVREIRTKDAIGRELDQLLAK